jgi:Uma2 family endonuclease
MTTATQSTAPSEIEYPDSDGQPMAENTLQFKWIVSIEGGLEAAYADDPSVFVAGDLLWYPVKGSPDIRTAPDVLVAFGRPKGDRGSYKQWEEGNVAPQVVFEVLSPGNRPPEMERKRDFYERYGVEEYYIYDPDDGSLAGWRRVGEYLEEIAQMAGYVSPRLGIRFEPGPGPNNLKIIGPDGEPFLTFAEVVKQRGEAKERAAAERERADVEGQRAEVEHQRAEAERQRAEVERQRAEAERQRADAHHQRAETERQRADAEQQRAEAALHTADAERERAERLAAQIRRLGIEPE